ncbi:hypothetical protein CR513_06889, partial [Mucuna pruriens]
MHAIGDTLGYGKLMYMQGLGSFLEYGRVIVCVEEDLTREFYSYGYVSLYGEIKVHVGPRQVWLICSADSVSVNCWMIAIRASSLSHASILNIFGRSSLINVVVISPRSFNAAALLLLCRALSINCSGDGLGHGFWRGRPGASPCRSLANTGARNIHPTPTLFSFVPPILGFHVSPNQLTSLLADYLSNCESIVDPLSRSVRSRTKSRSHKTVQEGGDQYSTTRCNKIDSQIR